MLILECDSLTSFSVMYDLFMFMLKFPWLSFNHHIFNFKWILPPFHVCYAVAVSADTQGLGLPLRQQWAEALEALDCPCLDGEQRTEHSPNTQVAEVGTHPGALRLPPKWQQAGTKWMAQLTMAQDKALVLPSGVVRGLDSL